MSRNLGRKIREETTGFAGGSIAYGIIFAVLFTLVCSAVYAFVVVLAPLSEKSAPLVARVVAMLATFLGGAAAGHRSQQTGWLHGTFVGLVYMVVVLLSGKVLSPGAIPFVTTIQRVVVAMIVAAIGGIAGVNL